MKTGQAAENERSLSAMRESANRLARRMEAEFVVRSGQENDSKCRQMGDRQR